MEKLSNNNIVIGIDNSEDIILKWYPPMRRSVKIEDRLIHLEVSNGYWLSGYILREQWNSIISQNNNESNEEKNKKYKNVTWFNAMKFCNALNVNYTSQIPADYYFSLPTELQWELPFHDKNMDLGDEIYREWCFDSYSPMPPKLVDWIGGELSGVKSCRETLGPWSTKLVRSYYGPDSPSIHFRVVLRKLNTSTFKLNSPKITRSVRGKIQTEDFLVCKDVKCFPGGSRTWDWNETGTNHEQGVQVTDILELIANGANTIILGTGYQKKLNIDTDTIEYMKSKKIDFHISDTQRAIELYNTSIQKGLRVGGLFHSTC